MNYLDEHGVQYDAIEVRGKPEVMAKMEKISGQTKTPTLVWNGEVLANFGVDELADFLTRRRESKTAGR